MDRRVTHVIILMETNLNRPPSLNALAEAVNLSPERLRHLFKSETKMTRLQYLKALRREHAKKLLETTFLSVKEIVATVGAPDKSHFLRDFKDYFGCSPAEFRTQRLISIETDQTSARIATR